MTEDKLMIKVAKGKYNIEFSDDFSDLQREVIEEVAREEMELLLGYYQEDDVLLEFLLFYVENEYLRFSAASDEPRKMWFKVNTFQTDFEGMIIKDLPDCIAHEFHHMVRWKFISKFHLAEQMIMEGLAIHFAMEVHGIEKPHYTRPVTAEILEKLMPKIREDLFDENFDHRIWQKGSEKFGIPPSFAYSYGFMLVEEYFKAHPGVKASDCFDLDCREFLRF